MVPINNDNNNNNDDKNNKLKKKCSSCFKKTLMLSECQCKSKYCLDCLPYFNHKCKFDWKTNKKMQLTNTNPVIQFSKIETI